MEPRHLEKTDTGYKVYLYIFYICGAIMASALIFGVYATMLEWLANGTYVMGEVIHNTTIPFENFAQSFNLDIFFYNNWMVLCY